MKKTASIEYMLYFLLVFLSIFIDSYFSRWFGYFGRPVLSVFLPVLAIAALLTGSKFKMDRTARTLLKLLLLLVVVNVLSDAGYMALSGKDCIGEEYVVIKSIKSIIQFSYILVYYILLYTLMKKIPKRKICTPFVFTFYFLFFVLLVELATMPKAWPIFHYNNSGLTDTSKYYNRVRLTATEASLTVPMIITYGAVTLWHYRRKHNKTMFAVSTLMLACFVATSTARTFIVFFAGLLVFLIAQYLFKRRRNRRGYILALIVLAVLPVGAVAGINYVYTEIFTKFLGSLATRMTSLIAALIHMFVYPFGMGNSVSILTVQNILKNVVGWFSKHGTSAAWNYWEVNQYILDPERISTYGILNYGLYWGVAGLAVLYMAFIRIYKQYKASRSFSQVLGAVFWGYLGIMTLTVPMLNCYSFWAFLVFINILSTESLKEKGNTLPVPEYGG